MRTARYGAKLRKKVEEIRKKLAAKYECPYCKKIGGIKRIAVGIWTCRKCGVKFAGLAYSPY